MSELKQPAQPEPHPEHQTAEQEREPHVEVTFLDRVIAFLLLVWPFSYLISWAQDLTADRLPTSIANIMVLIGIVAFLVVVGWLSKRIYRIRKGWGW